ncbi:MAG: hypothetical protein ACYC6Y_15350 [Thermoguttaceae bacterium]
MRKPIVFLAAILIATASIGALRAHGQDAGNSNSEPATAAQQGAGSATTANPGQSDPNLPPPAPPAADSPDRSAGDSAAQSSAERTAPPPPPSPDQSPSQAPAADRAPTNPDAATPPQRSSDFQSQDRSQGQVQGQFDAGSAQQRSEFRALGPPESSGSAQAAPNMPNINGPEQSEFHAQIDLTPPTVIPTPDNAPDRFSGGFAVAGPNGWRYRQQGNVWWYWAPGGYWMFHRDGTWHRHGEAFAPEPRTSYYGGFDAAPAPPATVPYYNEYRGPYVERYYRRPVGPLGRIFGRRPAVEVWH